MAYKTFQAPPKTAGQKIKEDLIFMVIGCIILSALDRFIEFVMKPLRSPTLGPEGLKARAEEIARQKRLDREKYYYEVEENENDPMHQFQLRFLTNIEDYRDKAEASNNKAFKEWYKAWKRGEVIDSRLKWAPEINIEEDYNPSFVDYMKIQLALHNESGSLFQKYTFYETIRKYYPELTPNARGLEYNLASIESVIKEASLKDELKEAIKSYGLPSDLAEYLAKNNKPGKIKEQAEALKVLHDHGFQSSTCICAFENGLGVEYATVIDAVIERGFPPRVGLAYAKSEITADDLVDLSELLESLRNLYGEDVYKYSNECVDECLTGYKAKNRLQKVK